MNIFNDEKGTNNGVKTTVARQTRMLTIFNGKSVQKSNKQMIYGVFVLTPILKDCKKNN